VSAGSTVDEVARLRHIAETQHLIKSVPLDHGAVMQVVIERAQAVTSADGGSVELLEKDDMVSQAASGITAYMVGFRLKVASSFSGRCVRLGVPMRCVDTEYDTRVDRRGCRHVGIRSMVVVPLMHGDMPIGVLKVVSTEPDHFDEADMETLQEMASLVTGVLTLAVDLVPPVHDPLHDQLTGLPNRHLLTECLEQACLKADRDASPLAVFLIDLRGFGRVNDRFGRHKADELLRLVADRLSRMVRSGDTLARFGRNEFVLVCESSRDVDAQSIVTRISAAVQGVAASAIEFAEVAAVVGVAWRDEDNRGPHELLSAADASMDRAEKAAQG
jgi:diguanylate cyclase (GGDEF)-like protein